MRFAWPIAFVLLLALPLIVAAHLPALGALRRRAAASFSSLSLLAPLGPTWRTRLRPALPALRVLCAALLVMAIARPQKGISETRVSTEGVAIEIVVDRSGSMDQPMMFDGARLSRLEVVKRVFREFVLGNRTDLPGRPNDLIGLITFASFAETICPLVRSRDSLAALVDRLEPATLRIENGTAIGEGIALAVARLRNAEEDIRTRFDARRLADFKITSKVIILLTDGDNNAGDIAPRDAARLAVESGIKIYAIGVAASEGSVVRTPRGDFQVPNSDLDVRTLTDIANLTGGTFFRAGDGDALRSVCQAIDKLERTKIESVEYTDYAELFPPLAIVAAAALLAELLLSSTILRRIP